MISTQRSRQLARGSRDALLPWENDKPTVMALREIAEGLIDHSVLDEPVEAPSRFRPEYQASPSEE
jgi:DNA-directed RNA polymerase subunit omega